MGTWGTKNFENDEALDFVTTIVEQKATLPDLYSAIETVAAIQDKDEYGPDSYDSTNALIAIELIAAVKGHPSQDFPETAQSWLTQNVGTTVKEEMIEQSKKAIRQVKTNSELQELWEESGEGDEWIEVLDDLEKRIMK